MEESNNDMALEKITSEVDETETKVFFSSYCLEAQEYLAAKLKKRCERHRETCSFINSTNFKVDAEIKHAEQEIRSIIITQESLKLANVELRKQWLLAINRKADILKRVTEGKSKYEALWSETKNRYESIHFVKKLNQVTERQKILEKAIEDMDIQITKLYDDIEKERKICNDFDKIHCIKFANFMVNDMPSAINYIREKSKQYRELTQEVAELLNEKNVEAIPITEMEVTFNVTEKLDKLDKDADNTSKIEDDPLIPKLNLVNLDLDIMSSNLEQVKFKKVGILNATTSKTNYYKINNLEMNVEQRVKDEKAYGYLISPYFSPYKEEKQRNYSDRRLINILEDININSTEAYDIVKKVQPDKLRTVAEISAERNESANKMKKNEAKDKEGKPIVSEDIEEIDLTASSANNVLVPPTQFLDITISDANQKKVSFDLSTSIQIKEIMDEDKQGDEELNEFGNRTLTSQSEESGEIDDNLLKTKEMLLKQHKLDLSPQFIYAKNNIMQKRDDDKIIKSKFFQTNNIEEHTEQNNDVIEESIAEEIHKSPKDKGVLQEKDRTEEMDVDTYAVLRPNLNQASSKKIVDYKSDAPVAGLLFTHGSQVITDSLNVSLSTVGFEDPDYPNCIDANVLLSPKANVPNNEQNVDASSQEVPNFLSGFRKTFFFGGQQSSESRADSSQQNEENFTFNFGGTKKNRGGIFSLFG